MHKLPGWHRQKRHYTNDCVAQSLLLKVLRDIVQWKIVLSIHGVTVFSPLRKIGEAQVNYKVT
jgi:hypothetical protein